MLRMDDYNPITKTYWWITAILGAVVLALAMRSALALPYTAIAQIGLAMTLAGIAGAFPYRMAGGKTSVSAAETVIFLALLVNGPAAAALAAATEGAVGSFRTSTRWTSRLGTPAMAGLAMYACGTLYAFAVNRFTGSHIAPSLLAQLAFLLPLALAYFATGTLLMASLVTLKQGLALRPWRILRSHSWMALVYLASAALAALLYSGYEHLGIGVFLAALPVIAVVMLTHRLYVRHIEDTARAQQERIATAQREAAESARHLEELQRSESRFEKAFAHAAIGMALVTHERAVLQANPALCEILGRGVDTLLGSDFGSYVHREDHAALGGELDKLLVRTTGTCTVELRCVRSDRSLVTVALHAAFFSSVEGAPCLIFQVEDITARRIAESRLQHIAHHDNLTGLPNRAYFFDHLSGAIRAARHDPPSSFAVLFLDCDRFKTINDSLGHRAGDELLVVLGRRIATQLRPTDIVARLGGDEFAILARDMHEADAIILATRLQAIVSEPVHIRASDVSTTASVGIAIGGPHYASPEDVMRDADIAMYRAKAQGRAQYAIFDTALHAEVSSQLRLETALRRAIELRQLHLAYQPIFDLHTRKTVAIEALCRWTHAERGAVPADRFIRVAEESGLIVPLGNWVLEAACAQLVAWRKTMPATVERLIMHVNVSGAQLLQSDCVEHLLDIIDSAGAPRARIALEVTETALIDRQSIAVPNLRQLRDAGLRISIDDFGTGYSSFARMWELPIGELKIDRSFVARMALGREGEEVVRAMVAMGRAMGKRIVAEGVETELQVRTLLDLGCHDGQGFWYARPLSGSDTETLLRQPRPRLIAI